jgi:hypothetical protein
MKKDMYLSFNEESDEINNDEIGETLVGVVHPESQKISIGFGFGRSRS